MMPQKKKSGFSIQFSERKLLLLVVDLAILNGALLLMLSLWPQPVFARLLERFPWYVLLLSGIWLAVAIFFSVYDLARAASAVQSVWTTGLAALITLTIYTLIPFVTPILPNRRTQLVVFFAAGLLGITTWRFLYASVLSQPTFRYRALVIGAGRSGQALMQVIREMASKSGPTGIGIGYEVLGFIDDDPAKQGSDIDGAPVLGTGQDLIRLARELAPDEIVIAITHTHTIQPELFRSLLACYEMGIPLTTMPELYEQMTGRVPVAHAGQDLSVLIPTTRPSGFRFYLALRRISDILLALIGLLGVLVTTPLVWLGNLLTGNAGDVFYRQQRVGKGGEYFDIIKFRSMVMNAEQGTGAVWARQNDSRITPVGNFLRKTRLDELPQFWNVLKGDMTLIGPRPERPEIITQLTEDIPYFGLRHAVKPGITGWAQVNYRYGASVEDSFTKLQYDLYYLKHLGPFIDLAVFLKTIQVIFGLKGR
jgi:exopolysaccharide biosynthesis polyprenyl glycosylphosphotransferase